MQTLNKQRKNDRDGIAHRVGSIGLWMAQEMFDMKMKIVVNGATRRPALVEARE